MQMTSRLALVSLGMFAVLTSAACSGSDDERPRYTTGLDVDAGTPISTLNDQQLQQICQSYDVYVNTEVDLSAIAYIACLPPAFFTTNTKEACQASLNNCMSLFPKPIKVSAKADNAQVCASNLRQCQAKVSDLEGCVDVNVGRALDIANVWSCDLVTDPSYKNQTTSTGLVSVCANVDSACNGFAQINTPD